MYEVCLQTILLIDDNPNDRLIVKRELNREFEDIAIQEIIDQKQFDLALEKAEFDFVITDFQLGWSNGLKTLSAIKERQPECPVIMFTNTGTQEIAVEAMKSGLDDYVIKSPQHFVRLCQAVRSAWRNFQTQRKAAELEQQLQSLLNQVDIGIFIANQSGQLLEANAATLSMLGVESLEAAQLALGHGLAATECPIDVPYTREIELTTSPSESSIDGRSLWLKIIATPSLVNNKVIVNGLIEDISARKHAEQALNQLNQTLELQVEQRTKQLEGINRELEQFTYSVSHDLRTPIRQIGGFTYLLANSQSDSQSNADQNEADQQAEHYLKVILELASRANDMIDALLAFSRTGRAEMVYERVDMGKVVRQLISQATDNTADNIAERSIEWRVLPLPTVVCDRALITTVWQNLIDNALKFTQSRSEAHIHIGTVTGDLEPSIQTSPEKTVFFIEDNGIGFDPKQSEQMFGMFQKAHDEEVIEGTGIGLASVKRIVARHRGEVWAKGKVNEGATFYFSLPMVSTSPK